MPEDLPTPKKSLKQLEKENNRSLKNLFIFLQFIKFMIYFSKLIDICVNR